MSDGEIRKKAWRQRLEMLARPAEPNRGHLAIVELERRGTLHALITQNIDGLHQKAGTSPDLVIEVHGTVRRAMCMGALARTDGGDARARDGGRGRSGVPAVRRNPEERHDLLRPAARARPSSAARCAPPRQADLLLAIGTSLQVYPIAGAVPAAHGGRRAGRHPQRASRRRSTRWQTRSWEGLSARRCRNCCNTDEVVVVAVGAAAAGLYIQLLEPRRARRDEGQFLRALVFFVPLWFEDACHAQAQACALHPAPRRLVRHSLKIRASGNSRPGSSEVVSTSTPRGRVPAAGQVDPPPAGRRAPRRWQDRPPSTRILPRARTAAA